MTGASACSATCDQYIDRLQIAGHTVVEDYDKQKYALQVELLRLQSHLVEGGTPCVGGCAGEAQ